MAGSPFFARIKAHVLEVTAAVPPGRVLCLTDLADWLDVPPRHAAYILSQLTAEEQLAVPWHRVVPATGIVSPTRISHHGIPQRAMLADEGITAAPSGKLDLFAQVRIRIEDLPLALPRQHRPADAPAGAPRRRRRA